MSTTTPYTGRHRLPLPAWRAWAAHPKLREATDQLLTSLMTWGLLGLGVLVFAAMRGGA